MFIQYKTSQVKKMYTEAFQDDNSVAVIWIKAEFMFKLPNSCTVFTAESIAILKALEIIFDDHLQDTIIITSLSSINNIKNTFNSSDISLYIQNKIYILQ